MLCNTLKKWINHIYRRKKVLKATKNWGLIYIDSYPFISTVFMYKSKEVKVKLHCPLTRDVYTYNFSSKTNIIDDHMLYLQRARHTRTTIQKKGYTHAKY